MSKAEISRTSRVASVVRKARRRHVLLVAAEQSAAALSLLLCGVILVILLGTQILDWYWLALLAAIGLTIAAVRTYKQTLTPYRVAQILDHRLALSDSLSTAWFLLSRPHRASVDVARVENDFARLEMERADAIAASVEPALAFPFRIKRACALTGALAAVALGLFAVRYLSRDSLDLKQSIVPIQFASLFERAEEIFSSADRRQTDAGVANNPTLKSEQEAGSQPQTADSRQDGHSASQASPSDANQESNPNNQDPQTASTQNGQPAKDGTKESASQAKEASAAAQPAGSPREGTQAGKQQSSEQAQSSRGLLDRMKDALSSLLAQMRPNSPAQNSAKNEQSGENRENANESAAQNTRTQSHNSRNQQSNRPSSQQQAQGNTTEQAQSSQQQDAGHSPEENGSDAHSGIGRQDGDKALREAEQLQAMGKLAEIIGKRSANITGEITVLTGSSRQQLNTAYSHAVGSHADLGGEINRDEVPLAYQQYVREYMEQIRKQTKGPQ